VSGVRARTNSSCGCTAHDCLKPSFYNDSREWRPICRSRCLNLTASGEGIPLWLCPNCDKFQALGRLRVENAKGYLSGPASLVSSKVGAIAVWKRKLSMAEIFGRFDSPCRVAGYPLRGCYHKSVYPHVRHVKLAQNHSYDNATNQDLTAQLAGRSSHLLKKSATQGVAVRRTCLKLACMI